MSTRQQRSATAAKFSSAPRTTDPAGELRTDEDRDAALAPDASPPVLGRRIPGSYKVYPAQYRAFGAALAEAADELAEPRVTRQDGIEAALRLISRDETVRRRWVAELRALMREAR